MMPNQVWQYKALRVYRPTRQGWYFLIATLALIFAFTYFFLYPRVKPWVEERQERLTAKAAEERYRIRENKMMTLLYKDGQIIIVHFRMHSEQMNIEDHLLAQNFLRNQERKGFQKRDATEGTSLDAHALCHVGEPSPSGLLLRCYDRALSHKEPICDVYRRSFEEIERILPKCLSAAVGPHRTRLG